MSFVSMLSVFVMSSAVLDMETKHGSPLVDRSTLVSTQELPQAWQTSYETARKMATEAKLPLVLHFDATWCGACVKMEKDVLQRSNVLAILGREVVGVKIDADQHRDLISEFGITTLPTEVVVYADGSVSNLYKGATSLDSYVSRLKTISGSNRAVIAKSEAKAQPKKVDTKPVRSCLIVRHDGKMVGVGGFSPVALTESKSWVKGSRRLRAIHEGVCYFFQSELEKKMFVADPAKYIPHLHGCDLVELHNENRVTAGAIEYGAFYRGQIFFFASLENRHRFESNPTWYTGTMTDSRTTSDELFPFLNRDAVDN